MASLPVRGAWIEMLLLPLLRLPVDASLPVRGAWIEIGRNSNQNGDGMVAPRAGSVD